MSSSSSVFKNLSPAAVRELKRHVSPSNGSKVPRVAAAGRNKPPDSSSSSSYVLYGCLALTATAASFPLVAHWWISGKDESSLANRDQALTPAQIRRGAFMNSGSKDVGRDPAWDYRTGTYQKDAGYYAIFQEHEKSKLSREFYTVPATADAEAAQQQQQHLIDFATGKVKQNGQPTPYRQFAQSHPEPAKDSHQSAAK
jgi:hypothetical protein